MRVSKKALEAAREARRAVIKNGGVIKKPRQKRAVDPDKIVNTTKWVEDEYYGLVFFNGFRYWCSDFTEVMINAEGEKVRLQRDIPLKEAEWQARIDNDMTHLSAIALMEVANNESGRGSLQREGHTGTTENKTSRVRPSNKVQRISSDEVRARKGVPISKRNSLVTAKRKK